MVLTERSLVAFGGLTSTALRYRWRVCSHYSVGDFVVYAIAALVLTFGAIMVALNVARNFRSYTSGVLSTLVTLAVIGAGLLAVGVIIAGVMWAVIFYQDQAMMRNCMTAYERQARAAAAPDDYFGKRLREQAADEAKKCAELATKKEAEANESKPTPRGSR